MFKRIVLCLLLTSSLSAHNNCHQSHAHPLVGGLLQIAHRHAYLLTFPLWPTYCSMLSAPHKYRHTNADEQLATMVISGIAWLMTARLAKTVSLVALNIANVPPLEE